MLLCDIGNTTYHFFDMQKDWRIGIEAFDPHEIKEKVFFISVNPRRSSTNLPHNWIDLEPFVDRTHYYETMGIDRIMACKAVTNAVVVDAGSAITVDVVQKGVYRGGFIYPGKKAFSQAFATISEALAHSLSWEIDLDRLPKNTPDALSYGFLSGFVKEVRSFGLEILLTGGDAFLMRHLFPQAHLRPRLVFEGMLRVYDASLRQ